MGGIRTWLFSRDAPPDTPGAIPYFYESFGVLRDDRDPEPSRRYKLGFLSIQRDYDGPMRDRHHGNQRRGLGVAVSPDGIHWRLENNWATQATCDGATHWMFDPAGGRYVLYGRTKYALPEVAAAVADKPWLHFWGRSVIRAESEDFLHWKETAARLGHARADPRHARPRGKRDLLDDGLPPRGRLHRTGPDVPQRARHVPAGDPVGRQPRHGPFHPGGRPRGVHPGRARGKLGPLQQLDRHEPAAGRWATRCDFTTAAEATAIQPYNGPEFPYHGKDRGESRGAIGLATIPRDRFVSIRAGADEGQIVTPPLRLSAGQLHLNANAAGGWIRVEVLAPDGHVVARSERIAGDALDIPVTWEQGSLAGVEGPVTLRITLKNAEVFALWCG